MLHHFLIIAAILVLPATARAERVTTWDLTRTEGLHQWRIHPGLTPALTPDGLQITAREEGYITHPTGNAIPFEVFSITYTAPRPIQAAILWHDATVAEGTFLSTPITLNASATPTALDFDLTRFPQWDKRAEEIGLGFPAGTEITLRHTELRGYSIGEHLREAWKTFWTLERIRPYSINFVWGPLLTFNPVARRQMFYQIPPIARSANMLFYGVLAITLVAGGWLAFHDKRRRAISLIVMTTAGLWIVYDLRMSAEFFATLNDDRATFWSEKPGVRTFRERAFLYDFADSLDLVIRTRNDNTYVMVADTTWPTVGVLRYATYPAVPVLPEHADGALLWAVYQRPDVIIDAERRLATADGPISPPGTLYHEFDRGTFLFTVDQP